VRFQRQNREEVSVNLTPLIDVVFLLLIFFMVSTTFTKESHLEIDLPQASEEAVVQGTAKTIEIIIDEEGQYSINGAPLVNTQEKTLRQAILKMIKGDDKPALVITADAKTPHQSVVTAMDVSGKLGFEKLSITTKQSVE
jgi:biopolymer transport protein ExbD